MIAHALRLRGREVLTTVEAGRTGAEDADQIRFATANGHCILSYNVSDFPRFHGEFLARGEAHGGIVAGTQSDPRRNIRAMLKLIDSLSGEEIANQLVYLSNWA